MPDITGPSPAGDLDDSLRTDTGRRAAGRASSQPMSKASERAYAMIRAEIMSGSLRPGEPLPEEHVAALCGVSRTPIREALQRLAAEGLVQFSSGRRCRVADWSLDSVLDAFELRELIESCAASRAAERISDEQLSALRAHNSALSAAVEANEPDVAAFLNENREFHTIIMDASGSIPLRRALVGVVEQPIVRRTAHQYDRSELLHSRDDHAALIAAFEARDPVTASRVMGAHLRRAARAYAEAFARARA